MELTTHNVPVSNSDLLADFMPGALRRICQVLSCASGIQGIEVTLAGNRAGEETMEMITAAKGIAREYDLIMYVRSKSGGLRITFVKQGANRGTVLPISVYEREHP